MNRFLVLAAAGSLVLAGCQNISQRQMETTAAGAIVGAGVGLLAGGDDGRNAAIGAVIGGIAGATVGTYMDRQEAALREQTEGTGIEVARVGDQIALTMPSDVTFPVNSSTIQPSFYAPLNDVASTLVEFPSTAVDIVGHASSDGPADYNQDLSERRAQSVEAYLLTQGMQDVRVLAYGRGEDLPIADNGTEAGRAANRRVEIILTPVVDDQA